MCCIFQSVVYALIGAYRGMVSALYFSFKNFYLLVVHKEEKIVLNPFVTNIIRLIVNGKISTIRIIELIMCKQVLF